tara:strand:- start:887 stop:1219 length:333 start_codon:yes stop_codon:yes gene_type:complete
MKPYLKDRVKTPYSDKTVGTVKTIKLSETGKPVCFVQFDRPCGPGPDSEAWFDSRDLRLAEAEEQTTSEDHRRINEWWLNHLDEVRRERDEAVKKLRRAVRVLTGVDGTT